MLYRNGIFAVILVAATGLGGSRPAAQVLTPRYGRKQAVDNGPRALALIQLSPKGGKGRLIPVAVMMNGEFYDAGAYKAAPVPMALDFGIVYEGFRAGVSQGMFTITQPGQLNHVWMAEGTWLPAGAIDPTKHKKYAAPVIAEDDKDGPPVLHRHQGSSDADSASESKTKDNKGKGGAKEDQPKPAPPASSTPPATPAASAPAADAGKTTPVPEPPKPPAQASSDEENIVDPNRPRLRRGKPDRTVHQEPYATFDAVPDAVPSSGAVQAGAASKDPATAVPPIVTIAAISDVGGPDPRPYTYDVKPAEEAIYRNKMLDLAAAQLGARAKGVAPAGKKSGSKSAPPPPKPAFGEVNLRIFDLSNSNEPVLVLSAITQPPAASATGPVEEPQEITLIARTNLEGELRKLFFQRTDAHHLDLIPRMELIDAVDADGDGRGELLFRRTFDVGTAYAIYRVAADRLWPLFEGKP